MSRTTTQTFRDEFYPGESGEAVLELVWISHAQFADERIVKNPVDVTWKGDTYRSVWFDIAYPDESPDRPPSMGLRIDNVDRVVMDKVLGLDQSPPFVPPLLVYYLVLESELPSGDAEFQTFPLQTRTVDWSVTTIEARFEGPPIFNTKFPAHTQSPTWTPGLFKK